MAAAAASWTDVVRQQAPGVVSLYFRAHQALGVAKSLLAQPMLGAEAQAVRGRIEDVFACLGSSSDHHIHACNVTQETEFIGLCGAATNPTTPLPSIEDIPETYVHARLALGLFQTARSRTDDAGNSLWRCRGHLSWACEAIALARGAYDLDVFLEAQRSHAITDLEAALASTRDCIGLALAAQVLVS